MIGEEKTKTMNLTYILSRSGADAFRTVDDIDIPNVQQQQHTTITKTEVINLLFHIHTYIQ